MSVSLAFAALDVPQLVVFLGWFSAWGCWQIDLLCATWALLCTLGMSMWVAPALRAAN